MIRAFKIELIYSNDYNLLPDSYMLNLVGLRLPLKRKTKPLKLSNIEIPYVTPSPLKPKRIGGLLILLERLKSIHLFFGVIESFSLY